MLSRTQSTKFLTCFFSCLFTCAAHTSKAAKLAPGDILLGETFSDNILRYGNDGTFKDVFISGGGLIFEPSRILVTPEGDILVASSSSYQILRFDINGNYVDVFAENPGPLGRCNGIARMADGSYLVTSTGIFQSHVSGVFRFASDGTFIEVFLTDPMLTFPYDIEIGPDDKIYISDSVNNIVYRADIDGSNFGVFLSNIGLTSIRDLSFTDDGRLLVGSRSRLARYNLDGTLERNILSTGTSAYTLVGNSGNLLVATQNRVREYGQNGGFLGDIFLASSVNFNCIYQVPDDDLDGDTLVSIQEAAAGTDPMVLDSDEDGLDDGAEFDVGFDPAVPETGQNALVIEAFRTTLTRDTAPKVVLDTPVVFVDESNNLNLNLQLMGGDTLDDLEPVGAPVEFSVPVENVDTQFLHISVQ